LRIRRWRESNSAIALSHTLALSNPERSTLSDIGKPLGRKHLAQVACITKPDTLLAPYRQLIASKFDGSKRRSSPGRPGVDAVVAALIVRRPEFRFGGTIALSGALANIGHDISRIRRSATS
jgi:hypothetical protein